MVVIGLFGLTLLLPQAQKWSETLFSRLSSMLPAKQNPQAGFWSGILIGLSLGLIWTPCVGPIIASVITLAATSSVNSTIALITLSYSIGTAIPMFIIMYTGRTLFAKIPWLLSNSEKIQKGFGVLMIIVALAIFFNLDRQFQTFILTTFPNYGTGLTQIEENSSVQNALHQLNPKNAPLTQTVGDSMQNYPAAPELIPGGQWFNTQPLTMSQLKGKVVLVDFWTYTCINCIRTLPYVKSWYDKYHDKGLVIIGVHTPEFEFEKDASNVQKALADFNIKYPVMQDNNYATWNAYSNEYWPADYLIDKNGLIRDTHFGEGDYDKTEKKIQELLMETGSNVSSTPIDTSTYSINTQSPETYFGYKRLDPQRYSSPEQVKPDQLSTYSLPSSFALNQFAYQGPWTITSESADPSSTSSLVFKFDATNVYVIMRSKDGKPGKLTVSVDGQPIKDAMKGDDVQNVSVTVNENRLYNVVKLSKEETHTLKLDFNTNNIELYTFTFG